MKNIFKTGDIVCDFPGSVWGTQRFVILDFFGNKYCQMVNVHKFGEEHTRSNELNLVLNNIRLVDATNRPFRSTSLDKLLKLITRGVLEARRELKMRNNTKKIKYVK